MTCTIDRWTRRGRAALAWLCLAAAGFAAEPPAGTLRGVVRSRAAGLGIAGATVILEGLEPGTERRAATDGAGRFAFQGLHGAGGWRVSASAPGFLPLEGAEASEAISSATELLIELELEPLRQTVEVEERVEAVSAAPSAKTFDTGQLAALPSNGRSLPRFALLDPHIRNTQGLASDGAAAARLSISAASFRNTYYLLDGAPNYDFSHGNAPQQKISVAAVQEFTVLPNAWPAEYGRSASGFVVAATRSGTDVLHGEGFFYGRPTGTQAAPVASAFRAPNELKQFGASVGGPLPGGRSNFFASFEEAQTLRGAFVQSPARQTYSGHFQDRLALVRLDHRLSASHVMALRVNGNRDVNDNPNDRVSGFVQPSAANTSRSQSAGVQWTDRVALGGDAANEFRASYVNALPSLTRAVKPAVAVVRPSWSTEGGSAYSWYRTESAGASDTVSGRTGAHQWKAGGDWVRQKVRDFSVMLYGEYRFAPGPPVAGQQPLQYTQTFGTGFVRQGQTLASVFAQDAWQATPNLSASFGLRYEYQSLTGDGNNFAPRLALAFDPTGRGGTVARASAGLFYDQYYMYISRRFFLQAVDAPTATFTVAPGSPGFPVFPDSLAAMPAGQADTRDLYLRPERLLNPYSLRYSLSLEQRLGAWRLSAEGVHTHGVKQMRGRDINAPAAFPRTGPGEKRGVAAADATRPFRQYAGVNVRNVLLIEHTGASRYDALELGLSRRVEGRLSLESRYLWSSAMGTPMFFGEPNTGIPADWGNSDRTERGPSDFHQRHRWVTHAVFEAPRAVQVGFVFTAASGLPVNPLTGIDNNGDTYLVDRPAGFGRNSFRGPANVALDFSLAKRVRIGDGSSLELRAEAFNALNRSNVIKVNATYGDGAGPLAAFGKPVAGIANSDPARQFQFGLKWLF